MCGRFTQTQSWMKLKKRFELKKIPSGLKPRYNIAPSQMVPVIVNEGGPAMKIFRWGLVPSWAKEISIGQNMINARGETISEKPSFRKSFKSKRCLVPADGFYEWRPGPGRKKIPMRIRRPRGDLFAFAGLWDEWRGKDEETALYSFTIVTTAANDYLKSVHDRMPVILPTGAEKTWLRGDADLDILKSFLKPAPNDFLSAFEVSTAVNSPRHDDPSLVTPASSAREELF